MPPPVQIGERLDPARARPVPFWRHGLAPPPRTMPRVLVAAVPWRRALSSARTHSCTSASFHFAAKTSPSSVTPPCLCSHGALGSAIGPDLHGAVLGPGHGPADQEQVAIGQDLDDLQPALRDALAAHAARPL